MISFVTGIFLVLHGLVHLLYFSLSRQYFDLDMPLVGWPERSWALSGFLEEVKTRTLASALYLLAVGLFVVGGLSYVFDAAWWDAMVVSAAVYSSVIIVMFWDGGMERLPDKGFVGLLINLVIIAAVLH